jgi:large subunit ribosomal protein L3
MALGLIGKKIGMMRMIQDHGVTNVVTVIAIHPNRIVQKKTVDIDGYNAIQVTTDYKTNKKNQAKVRYISSALKGHYAKAEQGIGLGLWEFRIDKEDCDNPLDVSLFLTGQFVNVTGRSKGKGFQGGVKRHNFKMQDATHGNSISHRAIGSTGQCQNPGRVFKGKKMPGQMGDKLVTQENLKIIKVNKERNILLVQGAVPGAKNSFVRVVLSNKKIIENDCIIGDTIK